MSQPHQPTPPRIDVPGTDDDSLTGRALVSIRRLVLRGEFQRGERISEIPLAKRLGMSRTPIRLALEQLAHMELLEVGTTGGFSVREFTIDEVRDAIALRGVLEGTAARLAAERLVHDRELEQLRACRDALEQHTELSLESIGQYMDQNGSFHAAIVDLAKSDMLRRLLEHANSLPFASPSAMVFPTSMLAASDETLALARSQHRDIVDAIENREATRAEHLAREHARIGWKIFKLALSNDLELSRVPGGSLINVSGS
jgi:GntR family transcriptional regulator of vanillate catabolism